MSLLCKVGKTIVQEGPTWMYKQNTTLKLSQTNPSPHPFSHASLFPFPSFSLSWNHQQHNSITIVVSFIKMETLSESYFQQPNFLH
jgi:hypothetical protein